MLRSVLVPGFTPSELCLTELDLGRVRLPEDGLVTVLVEFDLFIRPLVPGSLEVALEAALFPGWPLFPFLLTFLAAIINITLCI